MTIVDVTTLYPIVDNYYAKPGNSVGGSLHIVLEDGNLKRSDIEWCRTYAQEKGDTDGVALADLLLQCSTTQLAKLRKHLYG